MPSTNYLRVGVDASKAAPGAAKFDSEVNKVIKTAERANATVATTDKRFDKLGTSATQTGQHLNQLANGGLSTLDRGLKKTGTNAAAVSKKLGGVGISLKQLIGPIGATFGAFAAARSAITTIGKFEESMVMLGGVTGAAADTMQRLEETALRAGATSRFSASESADALLFLARAGFSADESISALGATQDLASVGMISVGQAADFASNLVKQFGLDAGDTARVVDSMTNVSNSSNTSVLQLAEAMKYAGPIANSAGIDIETAAAAIGALGDSGVQGSLAGTNLRGVLLSLVNPTAEARRAMDRLGLSFKDADPLRVGFVDAIKALADAQLDLGAAGKIFGNRNAGAALIFAESIDQIEKYIAKQKEGAGAAGDLAGKVEDTLMGRFRALAAAAENATLAGDGIITDLPKNVDRLADSMNLLAEAVRHVKEASSDESSSWHWVEKLLELRADRIPSTIIGLGEDAYDKFTKGTPSEEAFKKELADIRKNASAASSKANFEVWFDDTATPSNIDRVTDELVVLQEAFKRIDGLHVDMMLKGDKGALAEYQKTLASLQTSNRLPDLKMDDQADDVLRMLKTRIDDVSFALDVLDSKRVKIVDARDAKVAAEELSTVRDGLAKYTDKIELEIEMLGMSADERERFGAGLKLEKDLRGENAELIEKAKQHLDDSVVALQAERKSVDDTVKALKEKTKTEKEAAALQERLADQRDRVVSGLEREISLIGLSSREREIQMALMDAGVQRYTSEGDAIEELTGRLVDLTESERLARDFGDAWGNAFGQIATEAHNGRDALRIFLEQMQQFAIGKAADGFGSFMGDFFASFAQQGGGGGGGGGNSGFKPVGSGSTSMFSGSGFKPVAGNRLGGLFGAEGPINRLALGGVTGRLLTGPQEFMDAGGGRNVAGEAGEEVVMQVARDSKGRMGVLSADGGRGGGGDTYVTNINIRAENFETFRRSRRSMDRHERSRRRR